MAELILHIDPGSYSLCLHFSLFLYVFLPPETSCPHSCRYIPQVQVGANTSSEKGQDVQQKDSRQKHCRKHLGKTVWRISDSFFFSIAFFLSLEGKRHERSPISCLEAVSDKVSLWVWPKQLLEKPMQQSAKQPQPVLSQRGFLILHLHQKHKQS